MLRHGYGYLEKVVRLVDSFYQIAIFYYIKLLMLRNFKGKEMVWACDRGDGVREMRTHSVV